MDVKTKEYIDAEVKKLIRTMHINNEQIAFLFDNVKKRLNKLEEK